jgi:hypothetical protein
VIYGRIKTCYFSAVYRLKVSIKTAFPYPQKQHVFLQFILVQYIIKATYYVSISHVYPGNSQATSRTTSLGAPDQGKVQSQEKQVNDPAMSQPDIWMVAHRAGLINF